MLDIKYYKDYRHNYLILKDNGCLAENVYQRKMVTENKIKGLLESRERHINGDTLLYYEITSKQSLASIYDGKNIGTEQLCDFFMQMKRVNERLQKYLLDSSCLVLKPEYIFQDMERGEYYFLYYPDPEEGKFSELLDFLMARVSSEDMEAVEIVYKIADLTGKEQFVLDEILGWFQEDIIDAGKGHKKEQKIKDMPGRDFILPKEGGSIEGEDGEAGMPVDLVSENRGEERRKGIAAICAVWGTWILGSGVLVYLRSIYEFSGGENIYFLAGWIAMTVLALVFSAILFYNERIKSNKRERNQTLPEEAYRFVDTSEYETPPPSTEAGNTVFIPWTENCENKLYSMDRKNKCHIDLGKLPLTVGKMAGAVDMIVGEQSISRMHAKFSRDGNNIYITDLNSTNGTFKNGVRLMPNTSEMIEPGDEIRLGKLKFIYR
ncbi:MAG: FHA domain-containing protein [Lachnospiraceae bacterium]|nr:FHA domain-containing protein [Lachnospiraceae bacterium]